MKNLDKLKANAGLISLFLVLVVFLKQCGVSRDQDKIQKDIKTIVSKIDSIPNSIEVQKKMNETMFNFLIYEDDFDKKKTSLSEIRSKIDGQK